MIETILETGTRGLMKIEDNTDGSNKTVDLYIASSSSIAIPSLPWSYSVDGVPSDKKSFNFLNTTVWQHISKVFVGYSTQFTFHIDATGHAELGGPTDFTIDLQNKTKLVNVYLNRVWKKALPLVYVNGEWVPAIPMVVYNGNWTEVV
jgi:hypothetical protein